MTALSRVLAEPGSIAARKELAAEAGGKLGEIIEKQLTLREQRHAKSMSKSLRAEVKALIAAHGAAIAGDLEKLVTAYEFHRGMPAEVRVTAEQWRANAAAIVANAPVQHVEVIAPLGDVAALFAVPEWTRISTLMIGGHEGAFGDAGAIALAQSPHVANMKSLDLNSNAIGRPGVEALAASPYLERAIRINFAGNPADPTPFGNEIDRDFGRPPLAAELERMFGRRPWLDELDRDPPTWYDELGVTP